MNKKTVTLGWLLRKTRRRLPAVGALTLANTMTGLLGVGFALGTGWIIDAADAGDKSAFLKACVLQAAIIGGVLLCSVLARHLKERIHANLDRDWKKQLLHGLLNGDYKAVSAFHSGELVHRLNNDVRIVDDGIVGIAPNLCGTVIKLVVAFAALAALTPWFALGLMGAGLLVILVTSLVRRRLKELHKRVSQADGKVSAFLQEILEKLLAVQAMDIGAELERRLSKRLDDRFDIHCRRKNVSILVNACVNLTFLGAGFAALVWCSAGLLTKTITFGVMMTVIQLVNLLQNPLMGLSGVLPQYIAMMAAAERLMELDALHQPQELSRVDATTLYHKMDAIVAEKLYFSYEREQVFSGGGFVLPKGSFAMVSGASGIGKSTLLKLLLGIFQPEQGRVYASCGQQQVQLGRETRGLFAYVPQGNLIFSGTLLENLLVVRPQATQEEIAHAVYVSAMDEYLPQLPLGLDTPLGENGAGLSEGQAQRLSIARAVLSEAPVLLLDECTSALDIQTEALVIQRLHSLPDHTCIAVTHRPAMAEYCDHMIHFSEGKLWISTGDLTGCTE